MTECFLNFNHC